MSNPYYNHGGTPATGSAGSSSAMRSEFASVASGFDKLPVLSGFANKAVVVNAGGTALTTTTGSLALAGDLSTSGASAIILTSTGSTNVTLPTTGTLSTLAGIESLSNKTLVAPVLSGSVTGTYTLAGTPTITAPIFSGTITGAYTLGGTPTIIAPVLSGVITGTYTLGGTPTITAPVLSGTVTGTYTLASPSFSGTVAIADNVLVVCGSSDATKKIAFEVDGVSTSTTRTISAPDYNLRLGNIPAGIGPVPYAGSSIPTGWLECDGSAVSRTTYAALFTAIGTTFGTGDGATTFNLPDMRGKSPIGAGTGTTVEICTASSTNGFTVTANNTKWVTGMPVVWSALSGFTTSGSAGPTYYVVRVSSTNIRFATTLALAQAGTPDITISGSGSCTVTYTMTARTLGEQGGEETHAMSVTELLAHLHGSVAIPTGGGLAAGGFQATASGSTGSTGGNAGMNIMSPFLVTKYIISY